MSWSLWGSFWTASAGLLLSACEPAPAVQVLGESTRLTREEASPKKSAFFDGRTLSLRGARGETLGVSVRVSDGRARAIQLWLPEVAARVESFAVASLRVREPSTQMYGPTRGKGLYPDVLTPVHAPVRTSDLAYFDVAIPLSAAPGRHAGTLSMNERTFAVQLDVDRVSVDLSQDPLVWAFYLPKEIARVHGVEDGDDSRLVAIEARYHRLFRAHGVLLAADLPPDRFAARRRFVRDTRYWPVAVDLTSDATIERDVRRWLGLFRDSPVTPFVIPVDEPRDVGAKRRARHIAEVIGRAGGGRPRLLRAVTDVASSLYGNAFDVFISPKNLPAIASARRHTGERFWTYNGRPPRAGSMILDTDGVALRTWGWIARRYGVELWYAWEALYFSDRYNRGGPTDVMRDPVTFDERSRGGVDFGNGDGVLVYPGPLPSLRLKALRRGLTDRLLLVQLEACGGGAVAGEITRRLVPRALGDATGAAAWPTNEAEWEQARREILDAIEDRCHG